MEHRPVLAVRFTLNIAQPPGRVVLWLRELCRLPELPAPAGLLKIDVERVVDSTRAKLLARRRRRYPAPAGLRRRDVPPALAALGVTGLDPDMTVVRARATGDVAAPNSPRASAAGCSC